MLRGLENNGYFRPFTAVTRVRIPLGTPFIINHLRVAPLFGNCPSVCFGVRSLPDSCALGKTFDGIPEVRGAQVGIPENHGLRLVPEKCLKCPVIGPIHGQAAGKGVAKIVESKRGEGGLLDGLLEVMGEMGSRHGASDRICEDRILGNVSTRKRQKDLLNYAVHQDPPRLSGLGLSKEDRS